MKGIPMKLEDLRELVEKMLSDPTLSDEDRALIKKSLEGYDMTLWKIQLNS